MAVVQERPHEEVAADFITLPSQWNSRTEQIRRTMLELLGPPDRAGQLRKVNPENFETYLDAMLRHAFESFDTLNFERCKVHVAYDPLRDFYSYKVQLDVVVRQSGQTITISEDLTKFPSKELLGKILVFA